MSPPHSSCSCWADPSVVLMHFCSASQLLQLLQLMDKHVTTLDALSQLLCTFVTSLVALSQVLGELVLCLGALSQLLDKLVTSLDALSSSLSAAAAVAAAG